MIRLCVCVGVCTCCLPILILTLATIIEFSLGRIMLWTYAVLKLHAASSMLPLAGGFSVKSGCARSLDSRSDHDPELRIPGDRGGQICEWLLQCASDSNAWLGLQLGDLELYFEAS